VAAGRQACTLPATLTAVCAYDLKLGPNILGLEAAHIKWQQAEGPDTEENGLALFVLHHKLFERRAFTLTESIFLHPCGATAQVLTGAHHVRLRLT